MQHRLGGILDDHIVRANLLHLAAEIQTGKNRDAVIGGIAIPIGFNNSSLYRALINQPDEGMGERFEAFIIPKTCDTIENKNG